MSEHNQTVDPRKLVGEGFVSRIYSWITGLSGAGALGASFAAGALANLAFAPTYLWPVMMAAITFLAWQLDGAARARRPRAAGFWRGFFFALGLFGVGFHWIGFAFLVDPEAYLGYIWLAPLLPVGLALIWGGVVRLMMNVWTPGPARVVLLALALFAAEWIRGHLFGGFPWNVPAMVWAPGGAVSQSAALFGVYGLSALTLMAFAAPAALIDTRDIHTATGGGLARAAPLMLTAMIFGSIWGWGTQQLGDAGAEGVSHRVRLVDVGAPQDDKFDPDMRRIVLRRYLELTGVDDPSSPDVVVWPEGAVPYALVQYPDALDPVAAVLGDRRLIVGTSFVDRLDFPEKWYNALTVITRDAPYSGYLDIYYKHRLVPVGEMVPFRNVMSLIGLSALQQLATDGFHAGPPPRVMSVPGMPAFEPMICYEALFPGLMPDRSTPPDADELDVRAEWMVNISIDAWFGPLWAPDQHMEHARYRAIEEGLPMARVASRGLTGVIDGHGRLLAQAVSPGGDEPDGWKARVLDADMPNALPPTIFSLFRSWLLLGILGVMAAAWRLMPRR